MPKFAVIADFIDKETEELIEAGSTFETDDEDRIQAMKAAGVIGKEVADSEGGKAATEKAEREAERAKKEDAEKAKKDAAEKVAKNDAEKAAE